MVPKQYTPEYFPNWIQVPFCFNDLNSLSYVNNTLFDSYFEKVRIQFLLKIPELLEDLERKRFIVPRKSTNEYLTPILYCNTLFNDGSVHRVHASRVYILQVVCNSNTDQLFSTDETIGTWFDLQVQLSAHISSRVLSNYLLSTTTN